MARNRRPRKFWTEADIERLRELYPDTPSEDIAMALDRPLYSIYNKALALGLRKSAEYLAGPHACRLRRGGNVGAQYRFRKGHKTWNAGMKGLKAKGRAIETQFRVGQMPHNHVPVGTIVMATDGYLKIKVGEPKEWKWLHRKNWEDVHGPIPKGMALVFRDGNRENCAVDNLELITRQELARRNTIHRYPPELKRVIRLAAKLKRTIEECDEKQAH
jgi:hypothetical protein